MKLETAAYLHLHLGSTDCQPVVSGRLPETVSCVVAFGRLPNAAG